jgi:hypothetical protein
VGVGVVVRPGMSPPSRPPQPEEPPEEPPPDEPPPDEPPPDEPDPAVGVVVGATEVVVGGDEDVGSGEAVGDPVAVIVAEPLGAAVSVAVSAVVVPPLPPEAARAALDGPADAIAPPVPCVEALSDAPGAALADGADDRETAAASEVDAAPESPPPDAERTAVVAAAPLFDPEPPPLPPPLPLLVPPPPPPPPLAGVAAAVGDAASAVPRLRATPAQNPSATTSSAMSVLVTTPVPGAC